MKKGIFVIGVVSMSMLSGCSANQGPEGIHNVKWYIKHAPQMRKELSWCDNQAARKGLDACKNANAASNEDVMRSALGGGPLVSKGPTPTQLFNGQPE